MPLTLRDVQQSAILLRSLEVFFRDLNFFWIVTADGDRSGVARSIQTSLPRRLVPE